MRLAESINIVKSTILISGTLLYGYLPIWKQNFSNFRVRSLFQMAIYEFLTSLYTKYQHTNEITSQKSWWALSLSIQCEWMSKKEMLEHVYHEALCSKPLPSNLYAVQGKPVMSWQNGGLWGGDWQRAPACRGHLKNLILLQLHQDWKPGKEFSVSEHWTCKKKIIIILWFL